MSQINVSVDLPPTTFTLTVPSHFQTITLEDLRSIGPLRDRGTIAVSPIPISHFRFQNID
jgi:hypothetical protein